jgi:hypothetical protein
MSSKLHSLYKKGSCSSQALGWSAGRQSRRAHMYAIQFHHGRWFCPRTGRLSLPERLHTASKNSPTCFFLSPRLSWFSKLN